MTKSERLKKQNTKQNKTQVQHKSADIIYLWTLEGEKLSLKSTLSVSPLTKKATMKIQRWTSTAGLMTCSKARHIVCRKKALGLGI